MEKDKKPTLLNYILPLIMIFLGVHRYFKHGLDWITIIPIALGLFSLYLSLFNHSLLQRLEKFIIKAWFPIGQFISLVLLMITFFLVFAPVGILLRLMRKDILNRYPKNDLLTYWVDRPPKQEQDYKQQF